MNPAPAICHINVVTATLRRVVDSFLHILDVVNVTGVSNLPLGTSIKPKAEHNEHWKAGGHNERV